MIDNEQTIIGHLIRFPERAADIQDGLYPGDFISPKLAAIYRVIQERGADGYDPLMISGILKDRGWDIPISSLLSLEEFAIDGVDLDRIKEEINEASQKRTFTNYLKPLLSEIEKPGSDFPTIIDDLSKILFDLQAGVSTKDLLRRPSDFREELLNPTSVRSVRTGLASFDNLMGGFRQNELTVMTGETGSGKTTFGAAFIPFVLSRANHPVLIASFEMKPPAIQRKMVQMITGHPFPELSRKEKEEALNLIEKLPIHFIDAYGQLGLKELKGTIFRAHRQHKIELAILDHLHFFLKYSADHERQAIDAAMVEIKSWAMTLGIHIILVVHPTKLETENRPVKMNDLKGSSGLKQIPDNILSIWRPRGKDDLKKPQGEVILYVLKVRDDLGDEGDIILTFDKRSQRYEDSGPGSDAPVEGGRSPGASSPSSRTRPGRDWIGGYDQ